MKFASNISNLEIRGYFLFWIGVVLYGGYKVKIAGNALASKNNYDFSTGWRILGSRRKDSSDHDWEFVKYMLHQQFQWLFIHLVISEILRWKNHTKLIAPTQIVVAVTYLIFNFDVSILLIIFFQPILFEIMGKFKSTRVIWLSEIGCLIFLHNFKISQYFNVNYNQYTLLLVSIYWMNLKCVSYNINKINREIEKCNFVNMVAYCLYLPLFSPGPFIDFKQFVKSQESIEIKTFYERGSRLCINLIRFVFWIVFTDFILHYVYVSAISFHPKLVQEFDYWTLYGFGYSMGQYFHLKYVVLYGISTSLAKFENIPAPNAPKCIGRIHLYSDMWRYFDNGLYKFLVRYIYVPLLNNRFSPLLASFVCFSFIFIWHGITIDIFIWSFLNFACVNIESAFRRIYNTYYKKKCETISNDAWRQRISCILAAPLLAISAISNFYFFGGFTIGNIFFQRYFTGTLPMYAILLFSLYCCCQASSYVKRKEMIRDKTKI